MGNAKVSAPTYVVVYSSSFPIVGKQWRLSCRSEWTSSKQAKLAKLRRELIAPSSKGGGGAGEGFDVTKSGDARVGLVGFPSVGKSRLLNKITGTFSEVCNS